ncbi:PREDICTED: uncharacterized protein LOC105557893 [Vollenhovia emeryi]|uniref:uncharacterized protein LOC105557893 n=1 Tax=Vollenhovia emeryi TaxID=411798 RepID=UPI0005F3D2AE|nr:PREDICTED: uncharacterized protein LOC105557893 [Vollenhovia emeryi]
MLLILVVFGVISLSLNLFQIFQIGLSQDSVKNLLFPSLFAITCILYMFLANSSGQDVIDHTNYVFVTAYSVQWYLTPLYIQKTILFLLQRGAKKFTLNLKGLVVGSFECFAMVRRLLEQLQDVCNKLKDENEIAIIKKWGSKAKYYTTTLISKTMVVISFIQGAPQHYDHRSWEGRGDP